MSTNLAAIDTKPIENKVGLLRQRAEAIAVKDAETYAEACKIALDGRAEVKAIGFVLDPGIESAKNHLNMLKEQKNGFVNRVTPIIDMAAQKAEYWKAEERRKAAAEEERINNERRIEAARIAAEERKVAEAKAEADRKVREAAAEQVRKEQETELARQRKAGEINKRELEKQKKLAAEQAAKEREQAKADAERQRLAAIEAEKVAAANIKEVKVDAAVPKVAGIKARVNYKFEVISPGRVAAPFLKPDEVAIGAKVRNDKDPATSEREIGGIRVWTEDSI